MSSVVRPLCFVAMPFGGKSFMEAKKTINFDGVYTAIQTGVEQAGIDCRRADYDRAGGFIHRSMYESLLVAEFVIADLTLANQNVMYELGIRHGAGQKNTLLICAENYIEQLGFDFRPLRILTYSLEEKSLALTRQAAQKMAGSIREYLTLMASDELPNDNPLLQITGQFSEPSHKKTDLFISRMKYTGETLREIKQANDLRESHLAIEALNGIEHRLLQEPYVVQVLHTALIAVYLAYREHKAYEAMVSLQARLPDELKHTTVILEQLALAHNRIAEVHYKQGNQPAAQISRDQALNAIRMIRETELSSETYGIIGRIYKSQYDAFEDKTSLNAQSAITKAIEAYESGFNADPRDFYPGVNAITCRLVRAQEEDETQLQALVPVVTFAVNRQTEKKEVSERYWQLATMLELACIQRDWFRAQKVLLSMPLESPEIKPWMKETTVKNLSLIQQARADEAETLSHIAQYCQHLQI